LKNPHALIPGEILTPQQLFTKFLRWSKFARDNNFSSALPDCNELINSNLCCEHHARYQAESDQFFAYFFHLFMIPTPASSFSVNSMIEMMTKVPLFGEATLLQSYHGSIANNFFKHAKHNGIKII
jgi:hypothetical protein